MSRSLRGMVPRPRHPRLPRAVYVPLVLGKTMTVLCLVSMLTAMTDPARLAPLAWVADIAAGVAAAGFTIALITAHHYDKKRNPFL